MRTTTLYWPRRKRSATQLRRNLRVKTLLLIQEALKETGNAVILFDVEQPLEDVIAALSSSDVHFVFNVTTCVASVYSQALLPLLLDALGIPYLGSRPVVYLLCLDRSLSKLVLRGLSIPTPSFFSGLPRSPGLRTWSSPFL